MIFAAGEPDGPSPGSCGALDRHPASPADMRRLPAREAVKRKVQTARHPAGPGDRRVERARHFRLELGRFRGSIHTLPPADFPENGWLAPTLTSLTEDLRWLEDVGRAVAHAPIRVTSRKEDVMKRFTIGVVTAVLLVGAGAVAMAQGPRAGMMPPGAPSPPHERLSAVLGLTAEQKTAWDAARGDADGNMRALREQARGMHREIDGLLDQPSPDPAVLGQRMIALHAVQGQMRKAHEALDGKLVALLTPEQKLRFEEFKAAEPHGRGMRAGMWPPHDGPGMGPGMHGPGMPPGPSGAYPPGPPR
jgi:Spy/CpxP family protein refolding chaperone